MNNCQVKTGMFFLRECGDSADFTCADCGKFICRKHSINDGVLSICSECYGAKNKIVNGSSFNNIHSISALSTLWFFSNRHTFYSSHSNLSTFEGNDYNGFDKTDDSDFKDDSDNGDFSDS